MNKQQQQWRCGVCQIITFGEWDAEVKDKTDPTGTWLPCCVACTIEIREDFIEDE